MAARGDSVEVIRAVGDFFAQLDFDLEQVADVREDAVRQLRQQGWSYARIAEATGLSQARVAQVARATRAGGRAARRRS
jgi:uncharacterized protein YerC